MAELTAHQEAVWAALKTITPVCCGKPMEPGGLPGADMPMLVCTECSLVSVVTWEAVNDLIARAEALVPCDECTHPTHDGERCEASCMTPDGERMCGCEVHDGK